MSKLLVLAQMDPIVSDNIGETTSAQTSTTVPADGTTQASAAKATGMGNSSWVMMIIIFGAMFVLMWLMGRPQRKKQKELSKFREGIKKGDRVITAGGIYGTIKDVKESTVTVEVSPDVLLKVDKTMVVQDNSQLTQS